MQLHDMQQMQSKHLVVEGILTPDEGGWQVGLEDKEGRIHLLTRQNGEPHHYANIDQATRVLKGMGVEQISVVERF